MSKDNLIKELDKGDASAGTTEKTIKWLPDQVLEVEWSKLNGAAHKGDAA